MTTYFGTAPVPVREREDRVRDVVWDRLVRVHLDHAPDPENIAVSGAITDVGRITVCSVVANPVTIRRTARLVRADSVPSLFLGMQVSGTSMVIQRERTAVLQPGDVALYDTTTPYTLVNGDGVHHHYFRVPLTDLALPFAAVRPATAVRLTPADPLVSIVASYLRGLAATQPDTEPSMADALGHTAIELIRTLIAHRTPESRLAVESAHATLETRVVEYIHRHVTEPDLSAARIAAWHSISVRQLYILLARRQISLGSYLRAQRLEGARRELAAPTARPATIAAIGRRWCFPDAAHFSRVFRAEYGLSPQEWRRLQTGP